MPPKPAPAQVTAGLLVILPLIWAGWVLFRVLVALIAPRFVQRCSRLVTESAGVTLLWGLVAWVVLLGAMALLAPRPEHPGTTQVVSGLLFLLWLGLTGLGWVAVSLTAGRRVFEQAGQEQAPLLLSVLVGGLVADWLILIPVLGWLLAVVLMVFATGAAVRATATQAPDEGAVISLEPEAAAPELQDSPAIPRPPDG